MEVLQNRSGVMNHDGQVVRYGRPDEVTANGRHHSDVVAAKAVDFVWRTGEKPFFLYVADPAPHDPNVPADLHAGTATDAMRPPSQDTLAYFEEDISDKLFYVRDREAPKRRWIIEEHRTRIENL